MISKIARRGIPLLLLTSLAGCNTVLLNAAGDIARQQGQLIVVSTLLMLLIVVPVIIATLYFAWRYRQSNTTAPYSPEWDHSTRLELLIWGAPLLIIIALGLITWISTHLLEPTRPLTRLSEGRPIPASTKPILVQVVSLDWKWLFIYPDLHLASVNELHVPVDTPVNFKITAASLMNSFFIPSLGSQVYAMPGMQTELHLIANQSGVFPGMSSAFSGPGFADMHFNTVATSQAEFDTWAAQAHQTPLRLDRNSYAELAQDSIKHPVATYGDVDPALFASVVAQYMHDPAMAMPPVPMAEVCRATKPTLALNVTPTAEAKLVSMPALSLAEPHAPGQE